MFFEVEKVNQNWLSEKENLLDDAQLLIEQLNKECGLRMKMCVGALKTLNSIQKNSIYKDVFFLNWISELNNEVLNIYANPKEIWKPENVNKDIDTIINAVSNLKEKDFSFLSLPQFEGIKIVNRKIEVLLDEVSDLVDVEFDFEIDENKWLQDLAKALELIKLDSNSFQLVTNFVSYLVPLKQNSALRNMSFSTRNLPNVIFKNNERVHYLFGETLVHEADHQFFYLLENVDSFWITDVKLQKPIYCSPWRDDARPLDGIIRGLSAFTRVCHYYSNIIATVEGEDLNKVGELLLTKLAQCENAVQTIINSNQLSEFGNNYVQELKNSLQIIDEGIKHLLHYQDWRNDAMKGINSHVKNWEAVHGKI